MDRTARPSARSNRCPLPCLRFTSRGENACRDLHARPELRNLEALPPKGSTYSLRRLWRPREFFARSQGDAIFHVAAILLFCSGRRTGGRGPVLGKIWARLRSYNILPQLGFPGARKISAAARMVSVRPGLFWTSRACIATGPSLVLTLAGVEVISARRGKSGSGLKPVNPDTQG